MRVLHLGYYESQGGAALGMNRHHKALLKAGVESFCLVAERQSDDPTVFEAPILPRARKLTRRAHRLFNTLLPRPKNMVASLGMFGRDLREQVAALKPDVLNFHWMGDGWTSVQQMAALPYPKTWTTRDCWPVTGRLHYEQPERIHRIHDGYVRASRGPGAIGPDVDAWIWRRKRRALQTARHVWIAPSLWMKDLVERSPISDAPVALARNAMDLDLFCPIEPSEARECLGIASSQPLILFASAGADANDLKGGDQLLRAFTKLRSQGSPAKLLVVGRPLPSDAAPEGALIYLGSVPPETMALACAAADVSACPSLIDTAPKTVVESLACGRPVVCFDNSGPGQMVIDGVTGVVVPAFNEARFAEGLAFAIDRGVGAWREACRAVAEREYDEPVVVAALLSAYEQAMHRWSTER